MFANAVWPPEKVTLWRKTALRRSAIGDETQPRRILHIYAPLAEKERGLISERTKAV
jgi:hypothetical protein